MTDLLQTNAFLITLLALWMAAAVVSLAYFRFSRNAAAKRRLWPLSVAASAAMLVGLGWVLGFGVAVVAIVAVVVAATSYLNLRAVRFCHSCGATVRSKGLGARPPFCSSCGAQLGP